MKRFNPGFLSLGTSAMIYRDAATEGAPGGGDDAAAQAAAEAKAAEDAAALAAAEDAEKQAKKDADAAAKAAEDGDPDAKALAEEKKALLAEVMEKKSKLKDALADAASAKERLDAYGGVDPEKVKELLKKEADAAKAAEEAAGNFERVKEMMAEEHARELASVTAETERLKAELAQKDELLAAKDGDINELTIGQSFANSKFIQENLILSANKMRQLYGSHVSREDGKIVVYDKPKGAAGATKLVDARGEPLPFETAIERLVDADPDKKDMVKSKMAPGSKSKTATDKGTQKPSEPQVHGASRIMYALEKGGEL